MERTNVAFLAIVILSAALGANVGTEFGSDLQAASTALVVDDRIDTAITDATMSEEALLVTVELRNPTGYDFRLTGSHFRAFNGSEPKLAYASGQRIDDGEDVLASRGTLVVRYRIPLSPAQTDRLAAAFERGDAKLTGTHSFRLEDTEFSVTIDPVELTPGGDGA